MRFRLLLPLAALTILPLCLAEAMAQSPFPRTAPTAGSVVAAKGGEELRFVQEANWRPVEIRQDLVGGDTVRTNAEGNLAILFADQTQIRVGHNSLLTVRDVAANESGNTQLDLQSGSIWARAARGGSGVDIKTPAAVAAIRGTDWSLSVDGGRTSLIVLEGVVELRNPQGSVTVRQGEGAIASIGHAPTKIVLVNSDDREQMLFYLSLRDSFASLPATSLTGPAIRTERARIEAISPGARKSEDWLSLAEIALYLDGRTVAAKALAQARSQSLSPSQRARADLVEAILAGGELRWEEAAALFAQAEKGVTGHRRVIASYGHYIAESLAHPRQAYAEPKTDDNDPTTAFMHAYIIAFRKDLKSAADIIKAAEKRFPNDARLAVTSGRIALLLNRRDDLRAAVTRAAAIDPQDPNVKTLDNVVKGAIDGEVNAAIDGLRQAAALAPGDANIWNDIGLLEAERDAPVAAEEAFRRAIAEDPKSSIAYANLAIVLLDQDRADEAGSFIDKASSIDPSLSAAYVARGRYWLQKGETAKGIESILAGSAANPGYAQALLLAAAAYYQNGDDGLAQQALDNADRLDANDPVISTARTAIAIDQDQPDQAILNAQETIRRYRRRGGDFAGLAVNREGGSYPSEAYRFLNLNEWGRFYGDRTFDAFTAAGYFDQAASRRDSIFLARPSLDSFQGNEPDVASYDLTIQGLFFDPLAVASRIGRLDLLRRPFIDGEVGGGAVFRGGKIGWEADATVEGFSNTSVPTSFALSAGRTQGNGSDTLDKDRFDNASVFIGMAPSAADRFLVFGSAAQQKPGLATINQTLNYFNGLQDTTSVQGGTGWSHSFSDRNVLTGAVYGYQGLDKRFTDEGSILFPLFLRNDLKERTEIKGVIGALNHTVGFDDFTLRYGIEGQSGDTRQLQLGQDLGVDLRTRAETRIPINSNSSSSFQGGLVYGDLSWRPSDRFEAQAGIRESFMDVESQRTDKVFSPRAGIGFSPLDGQWLRAAYSRDGAQPLGFTLAPIATLGLIPNTLPLSLNGQAETIDLRWDAEWTSHVFTAVEYQRQNARNLDLPIPGLPETLSIDRTRIDRVSATGNVWLGYGIGVFATAGLTSTDVPSNVSPDRDLPFVPGHFARAGLTFVHPSRLRFTIAENLFADMKGTLTGARIDDYWTTDASISWETPDRRLLFDVTMLNLLNETYEVSPGVRGTGRTISASVKARF